MCVADRPRDAAALFAYGLILGTMAMAYYGRWLTMAEMKGKTYIIHGREDNRSLSLGST